jgi:hypothetical protein
MSVEPTPPVSLECWLEILEEMANPPANTPERRATFARARIMEKVLQRSRERGLI